MNTLTNFHGIHVKFLPATDYKGERVRLKSDRFNQSVIFGYSYNHMTVRDDGVDWLKEHGFNLVGQFETKDGYYLLTDTFKPLREETKQ